MTDDEFEAIKATLAEWGRDLENSPPRPFVPLLKPQTREIVKSRFGWCVRMVMVALRRSANDVPMNRHAHDALCPRRCAFRSNAMERAWDRWIAGLGRPQGF